MSLISNDRATFDYEILEKFEAGLELLGTEVKSLRQKQGSLKGARVLVRGLEAYLVGATFPAWQIANTKKSYEATRTRRLLLNKKEIATIESAEKQRGLTAIPLSIYAKGRTLKLAVAIARGKKKADKRESIKARDLKRSEARILKA